LTAIKSFRAEPMSSKKA